MILAVFAITPALLMPRAVAATTEATHAVTVTFTSLTGKAILAPHCELKTGNTYLRTSGAKKVVGFKPKMTCDEIMDTISLTGQMYAVVGGTTTTHGEAPTSTNAGQVSVENKQIGYNCDGTENTVWFGRASVNAVWRGIPQAAVVDSPTATLPCGV
ncbi:hypothetical protein GCM10027598_57500 [Amycolatopsis oliviviridis]|uniref:Uncharacterized protein n=2 Tax=Amycolatopsis oliviviridis TaxID=1471590 RepID=A0ABQ3LX15_9PSEU|nr:hypothetical protein GCM10017790_58150 [Amycolatopsis oliviviridis]